MQALQPPRGGRVKITQPIQYIDNIHLIELRVDISYSPAHIVVHGALLKLVHMQKIKARFRLDHYIRPPLGCRQPILYVH